MSQLKKIKNICIDFEVIKNSNLESLKKELKLLIDAGKFIYLWSKNVSPKDMELWCIKNKLWDWIWDYLPKDSFNYSKADYIIDDNQKFVSRFNSNGILGNCVKRL